MTLIIFPMLFPALSSQAATSLDVVINEVAWMGTETSVNDEWVELYNNTNVILSIDGWLLEAADGTPQIDLVGTILPGAFYLLERTDDTSVPGIAADFIYTGALNNSGDKPGESLKLYDNNNNLIDSVDCSAGWFAGDNNVKQTMERKNSASAGNDSSNWGSSQNTGGTPGAPNSTGSIPPSVETINDEPPAGNNDSQEENLNSPDQNTELPAREANEEAETPPLLQETENSPPLTKTQKEITYPAGVVFNEILPSPEGPDETDEWIELFNGGNFEVDLSGWKISDSGNTPGYIIPEGMKIGQESFLVFPRPQTKITLNDSDSLKLILPNGNLINSVSYGNAPTGNSYNLTEGDWAWSDTLTPGSKNIVPLATLEETENNAFAEEEQNKTWDETEKQLASVGEQMPETSNSLPALLGALFLAAVSGASILILKKTQKNKGT